MLKNFGLDLYLGRYISTFTYSEEQNIMMFINTLKEDKPRINIAYKIHCSRMLHGTLGCSTECSGVCCWCLMQLHHCTHDTRSIDPCSATCQK